MFPLTYNPNDSVPPYFFQKEPFHRTPPLLGFELFREMTQKKVEKSAMNYKVGGIRSDSSITDFVYIKVNLLKY